ncbi:Eco57I restriction-modification methylase domain-containing protein [Mycolicibacterium sp. ND9-15]|uniref:Eco57I restriction-modification methylase domain-containing protein n=1 Tax=Mycolicibacterium sp. ND9-15 TaxID=3042320 RepID=UPI002DD9AB24|nr:Eco57I restriction-modification methylase domain-containing protein [Mycolicibacterium sp. ND9-15]WSE57534.1 Eco57I restriction-modification methylase domain-containing protein [Mycolicibacterium sp. ND9-15]
MGSPQQDHDGADIWSQKSLRFLDPFTKSGVFLREIASRLIEGLKDEIPDLQERVDHILTKQIFGVGITTLTSLIARRSVYCSKLANGKHSVAPSFTTQAGNIWFEPVEHTWIGATEFVDTADSSGKPIRRGVNGKCKYCGASQKTLDRGEGLETHAYAFIHNDNPKAFVAEVFGDEMQFDVVIGNPPYQLDDGGYGTSAAPIYNKFVERALDLAPRYAVFITPSRWFAGGKGLDKFRERLLSDRRMRNLVDYPKLYDGFPGVKIRGGVSYFLWDRDYDGPCTIQTMWDGQPVGEPAARYLDDYDVLVRWNDAVSILDKVRAKSEPTLDERVSSRKPFGLPTNFHGKPNESALKEPVKLYGSQKVTWVERQQIQINQPWIHDWKVLMTAVQGTSAAVETKFLSKPIVAGPGTACTETYLVAGRFPSETEADRYASYLRTRFVRFLVSLRKSTQHATRDVYAFVPDVPYDEDWTDEKLYKRYGLTTDEIEFIKSQVAEHDDAKTSGVKGE